MTKCPICGSRKCADTSTKHLLASFDLTFDGQGLHGAGMGGGALYGVREIGDLLGAIQMARVLTWKSGGPSAPAPPWIKARPELTDYFKALGNDGFDLKDYQDLQEAADFIPGCTASHGNEVRSLLQTLLIDCGWDDITSEDEDDVPLAASAYSLWWDEDAEGRAFVLGEQIRATLKTA